MSDDEWDGGGGLGGGGAPDDGFTFEEFGATGATADSSTSDPLGTPTSGGADDANQLVPSIPANQTLETLPPDIVIPAPRLQNVIASVDFCTEIDLRHVAISARNVEYNPSRINALVLRLREPKCTGLLFRSGRMMVTGARTEEGAKIGGKKMAKLCLKLGHPNVRFRNFKIENLIASVDCGFPIRLEGLALDHRDYSSYEPELFSGLVYRYQKYNAVMLIFVSGKVIICGCRTIDQVQMSFNAIFPALWHYQK